MLKSINDISQMLKEQDIALSIIRKSDDNDFLIDIATEALNNIK